MKFSIQSGNLRKHKKNLYCHWNFNLYIFKTKELLEQEEPSLHLKNDSWNGMKLRKKHLISEGKSFSNPKQQLSNSAQITNRLERLRTPLISLIHIRSWSENRIWFKRIISKSIHAETNYGWRKLFDLTDWPSIIIFTIWTIQLTSNQNCFFLSDTKFEIFWFSKKEFNQCR